MGSTKGSVRSADRGRDLGAGFLASGTSGPVSGESLPYLNHLTKSDTAGEVLQALVRSLGIVMISDIDLGGAPCFADADRTHPTETPGRPCRISQGQSVPRVADELDSLFTDEAFLALFPTHGQPALPPWRLALVTILQFAEGLPDRQRPTPYTVASIGNTSCAWS